MRRTYSFAIAIRRQNTSNTPNHRLKSNFACSTPAQSPNHLGPVTPRNGHKIWIGWRNVFTPNLNLHQPPYSFSVADWKRQLAPSDDSEDSDGFPDAPLAARSIVSTSKVTRRIRPDLRIVVTNPRAIIKRPPSPVRYPVSVTHPHSRFAQSSTQATG